MANNTKKYVSLTRLSNFLDNIKAKYSQIGHKHTISDIANYTVDSSLSPTSTNPVQNKVLDAEFEAMATAMGALELAIDDKANSAHTHDDRYYTETEVDTKLSNKANSSHAHAISDVTNLQSTLDGKVPTSRTINNKALTANITLSASDVGAAASSHNHNDVYYTETEVDTKLASKSDKTHNHDTDYDTKGAAAESLTSAKSYTDSKTANLASTTVVDNKVGSHNTSASAHNDIRDLISGLTTRLNTLANSDDTTLDQMGEVVAYIKNNKSLIDGITTSKVNVADIVNNLTTNVTNKPLSAAQGVAIKSLIDALQEDVDGKSDVGHTHDDRYYTESEIDTKISTLNTAINTKQDKITGAATTILKEKLIPNRAMVTDALGNVWYSDVSAEELSYLKGASENIQKQLDESRTHWVEGNGFGMVWQEASHGDTLNYTGDPEDYISVFLGDVEYKCRMWTNSLGEKCYGDSRITTMLNGIGQEVIDTTNPESTPFYINCCADDDDLGNLSWTWTILFNSSISGSKHTITIFPVIYHTLNENFIPDTIARTSSVSQVQIITWEDND